MAPMSVAVTRSVSVHASAADAFDAFTRVSDLLSWLCEGALVGLRPGGNWAVGFTDGRGLTEATVLGKIEEFERGRRLVVGDISYEPRAGDRGAAADAGMRLLAALRGLDHPARTAAQPTGLEPACFAVDLHSRAQFSGNPASIRMRRRRGPSRYRFRSARLASQPVATSPWYFA